MKRLFLLPAILLSSHWLMFADDAIQQKYNDDLFYQEYACPNNNDAAVKSKEEEERIQHLAIATVANMAQGIVNIGNHSDDPQAVAKEVAGIMANFTTFVLQAMKNPAALKLLEDEQFCNYVAARIRSMRAENHKDEDID